MSLRAYTDHVDDYNRTHTIEIHKQGYDSNDGVDYLKNTGSGYASFDYEKIDPKNPTDNPIQKGALEFSLWLQSSALIDEIKTADEQTFWAIHKVDGTQQWIGYIYNDLSTYEEGFENHPFRITLMAKDFTDLSGKDYLVSGSLPDSRERVIATIAHLLDTVGFDMPIKTHTSWIEENLSGDYDYLNEIYHETKALREFGRTGDETDQPITVEDALNKLCVNHGLLLKQADGCYWIDQLTEYEDPDSVQEATYDLTGSQTAFSTTNDLTVDANTSDLKVTIQQDNRDNSGLPGLKRIKNKYDHRTKISGLKLPDSVRILNSDSKTYSQLIISDGGQEIEFGFVVSVRNSTDEPIMKARFDIEINGYYLQDDGTWDASAYTWEIDLTQGRTPDGTTYTWRGDFDITTETLPADADGTLTLTLYNAIDDVGDAPGETIYGDFLFNITNPIAQENTTSIDYQLTQSDNFSVVSDINDTWFGDGPVDYSVGALRYDTGLQDTTADTWQRRGSTTYRNFHNNLLAEHLDVRRGWRRLLSATLKGLYYPWQILSYDSEYFYFLGGSWDLFTGNWEGELFSLDIQTSNDDTFEDIPKFTDETGSGSGSTSSGGGGGLDQSTADARYLQESNNLSDLDSASTAITNLGITATASELNILDGATLSTAELNLLDGVTATTDELNQLDGNVFTSKIEGTLADFSGSLDADTLRTDTGKFLAPTSYQFRNAGDTGFRDVEMAGLTATKMLAGGGTDSGEVIGGKLSSSDQYNPTGYNQEVLWLENDEGSTANTFAGIRFSANDGSGAFADGFITFVNSGGESGDLHFVTRESGNRDDRFILSANGSELATDLGITGDLSVDEGRLYMDAAGNHIVFNTDDNDRTLFTVDESSLGNESNRVAGLWWDSPNDRLSFEIADVSFTNNVLSEGFNNATWAGNGYRGTNEGDWVVENLRVRNALEVYEFVAKQISSVGGKEILSIANGRIESVDSGANEIEVQDVRGQNTTSFEAGDLWIVQVTDINNDLESGGTGSIVRSVRGSVTSVSGATLTVSVDSGALSDLEENDLIVAYGSSNSDRNAIMYRNVNRSDDNLIMRMQTGVDSFTALFDEANTAVAYGDLNGYLGISNEEFGFFAGDVSGNYILATENQVNAKLDDLKLDVIGSGSSGFENADFFLDASAHQMSLGSVFSADGGADEGRLASSYFDSTDLWGGNATKTSANIRLDFANSELTTQGTEGITTLSEGTFLQEKVTGNGQILIDALDSIGSRIDIDGESYKVVRFQEGSNPQIGVPQEYTGSTGGSANSLPSQPVSYIPIEVPNENTGQVNLYVIPVYDPASTPDTPTNVTLCSASSPDGIQISWDNMSVDEYEVQRAENSSGPWSTIGTTSSTSFLDSGSPTLQPDTTFYYRVRSIENGLTSGWSDVKNGSYNSLGSC